MLKYISGIEHVDNVVNIKRYKTEKRYGSDELLKYLNKSIKEHQGKYQNELSLELGEVKKLMNYFGF